MCYGVSRASYIFNGCITLYPLRERHHPAPRPTTATSIYPSTGHLLTRHPPGPFSIHRWTKFSPVTLAKLELQSSFRDRLMFRRFIKTEKHRCEKRATGQRSLFILLVLLIRAEATEKERERESLSRRGEKIYLIDRRDEMSSFQEG